jgi:predicted nucleic acid-binding protein
MRAVFLDTVGLIALWNRSDQWHDAATAAFASLDPRLTHLVTTAYILLECGNEAARRPYRNR